MSHLKERCQSTIELLLLLISDYPINTEQYFSGKVVIVGSNLKDIFSNLLHRRRRINSANT